MADKNEKQNDKMRTGESVETDSKMIGKIPRGMEILIKKASVDPAFKERFLKNRSKVAEEIELTLSAAEKEMLDTIPPDQLESIIANTKVNSKLVPILLKGTAAMILVALGVYGVTSMTVTLGNQPDIPPDRDIPQRIKPDIPSDQEIQQLLEEIRQMLEDNQMHERQEDFNFGVFQGIRPDIDKDMKFWVPPLTYEESDKSSEDISPEEQ